MDEKNIRIYAQLMRDFDLSAFELKENGCELRLERSVTQVPVQIAAQVPTAAPTAALEQPAAEEPADDSTAVRSPMIGVFYSAPAENASPFVSVGDHVSKGDVICIIEAMKLMNEITSEYNGTITEICVGNGQAVDYGHLLFRLKKDE